MQKNFKKHDKCYRDYTRVIYSEFKEQQQSVYDSVNYEAFCKIIADQVIGEFKCVSMGTVITAYGIGHNHPQYRLKLEIIECSSNDQEVTDIMQKYQEIKLKGLLGETAQFWLTYMELISQLHLLLINTNNLTLKIKTREKLLPFCFVTNKIH